MTSMQLWMRFPVVVLLLFKVVKQNELLNWSDKDKWLILKLLQILFDVTLPPEGVSEGARSINSEMKILC